MSTQLRQVFDAINDSANDYREQNFSSIQEIQDYADNGMQVSLDNDEATLIRCAAYAYTVAASEGFQSHKLNCLVDAILEA